MYVDDRKKRYFSSGGLGYNLPDNKSLSEKWMKEYSLCNCFNCGKQDCKHRMKNERFPVDAGGGGQCIQLQEHLSAFAFENGNGDVIVIPDEIVSELVEQVKTELEKANG